MTISVNFTLFLASFNFLVYGFVFPKKICCALYQLFSDKTKQSTLASCGYRLSRHWKINISLHYGVVEVKLNGDRNECISLGVTREGGRGWTYNSQGHVTLFKTIIVATGGVAFFTTKLRENCKTMDLVEFCLHALDILHKYR